ncbi:MAG TPA: fibronectin type III domain-containing protein [Pyrinomonadaceae bacterium]|nr:fibronectin type III domain-containing protein [Pyrinomonadaceae bacterium]
MANKIYPSNDAEFAIWLANFINKADLYKAQLNLTGAQITNLQTKLAQFTSNIALKQQKKEESVAQTALVKDERTDLNKDVGLLNNGFKAIDGLPGNILEELGLNINESNIGTSTPTAPTNLVATGTSDGTNSLKYNRNGNRQGTTFIIEAKIGDSNTWAMIDAVTGSTYKHKNQTPGVKIQYRIKAKRGDLESSFSNTAVVYG